VALMCMVQELAAAGETMADQDQMLWSNLD
jgi:hypothetical protein